MKPLLNLQRWTPTAVPRAPFRQTQSIEAAADSNRESCNMAPLGCSRRQLVHLASGIALTGVALLTNPSQAEAGTFMDLYRSRQQQNGGALLTGPIKLSRQRLQAALASLAGTPDLEAYKTALQELRKASLRCYVVDAFENGVDTAGLSTAGTVGQEYKLGDPCIYRLVVKNATAVTADAALVGDTEAQMQSILRQLQRLDDKIDMAINGDADASQAIPPLLEEVIDANVRFEQAIAACLGLA